MEVDVHAPEAVDKLCEKSGRFGLHDVDRGDLDLLGCRGTERFERLGAAAGDTDAPPLADVAFRYFESDAGGGSDDDDAFHGLSFGSYWRCWAQIRCPGGVGG